MIMAIVLVRILVQFVATLAALVVGLVLCGIGHGEQAAGVVMTCAVIAWMARPDPEERAAFDAFQRKRLAKHGMEI